MYDPADLNAPLPHWVEVIARTFLLAAGALCLAWGVLGIARGRDPNAIPFGVVLAVLGGLQVYLGRRLLRHQRIAGRADPASFVLYLVAGCALLLVGLLLLLIPENWWERPFGALFVVGAVGALWTGWHRLRAKVPPHAA
jgi:hypothetical protein